MVYCGLTRRQIAELKGFDGPLTINGPNSINYGRLMNGSNIGIYKKKTILCNLVDFIHQVNISLLDKTEIQSDTELVQERNQVFTSK